MYERNKEELRKERRLVEQFHKSYNNAEKEIAKGGWVQGNGRQMTPEEVIAHKKALLEYR